ncbi:MAG: hypothetical protein AVDCRST_MAG87-3499 [uncultured Thermomicrobiales bacterium]|uniref:Uncharacterized protein n=1 Tax=uncultured Thermomicrobiales bacterium TaxID=1645740 RepID=A0A6J4VPL9_9BACT|nr:MAG: hypothetical protein AVDCRST_MAG87-3499 [uncultured Thermomicrobiales bacterium]
MKKLIVGSLVAFALITKVRAHPGREFRMHGGSPWAQSRRDLRMRRGRRYGHGFRNSGRFAPHTAGEYL